MAVIQNVSVKFNLDETLDGHFHADSSNSPLGFCRLKSISSVFKEFVDSTGFMVRQQLQNEIQQNTTYLKKSNIQGPSFEIEPNIDHVPALKCLDWPKISLGFFKRKRYCPSQNLLKTIKANGIHVVCKSSTDDVELSDPYEFRTSFSMAEKTLIRNLTDSQFTMYYFLKVIKNDFGDNYPLKSYHIKTVFLWMVEASPQDVWTEEKFLSNAKQFIENLHKCFRDKYLSHYFVEGCNLLMNLSKDQCMVVAKDLEKLLFNWHSSIIEMFFGKANGSFSSRTTRATRSLSIKKTAMYKEAFLSPYH